MATLPDVNISEIPNHYEGDTSEFSDAYLQGKLDEVVDEINVRWGSLVERRLTSGALPLRLYKAIVVRVAARVWRNTEGYVQENEGQYGYRLNTAVASGALSFSPDDEASLTGIAKAKSQMPRSATMGIAPPGGGWVR